MKKISISIVAIILTSGFTFAQNAYPKFELSKFRDLDGLGSNFDYLNEVQNGLTPNQVRYLENLVSYWDVKKSVKFNGRKCQPFNATFKSGGDEIIVSYDSKGRIVSTMERFSNFAMPKAVGKEILRLHPNWKIVKNRYYVWYNRKHHTKRVFKVQIQKGDRKKWLRVDQTGGLS